MGNVKSANIKSENIIEKSSLPIGVFDSGVGGISILRELIKLMPNENYIYLGDSANAPYGTKSLEQVVDLVCKDAAYLYEKGIKALVVACNTATSAGIQILREQYTQIPVIGIEPALKPAVFSAEHPTVLVMATPMTLRENKFCRLMQRFETEAEIVPLPCPGLMEFVERGELEGEALEQYLQKLFAPYSKPDAVVLGCTHYPFVRGTIEKILGDQVLLFDGGAGTARETKHQLEVRKLLNSSEKKGKVIFENSEKEDARLRLCENLLNYEENDSKS